MDDAMDLLCASHACGGHSDMLARWLVHADQGALDDESLIEQAQLSMSVWQRFRNADRVAIHRQWTLLQTQGWELVRITDQQHYPPLLRELSDPPGVLYVRGRTELLQMPQIAIVGARGASAEGRHNAEQFAHSLSRAGFCITSGLAAGIDASAHRAALPDTIAVLGHGADRIYPSQHRRLAEQIGAGGLLVTEYPPGLPPRREHFPARNRIISGLSLAVVVIEAAAASGSLITARLAASQGRDVFAVPGSIHNPFSRGCHQLLRDGALWLESLDDLLAHFDILHDTASAVAHTADDPLLELFIGGINSMDMLAQRSGLPWPALTQALLDLELAGRIERVSGGFLRRQ